MFLSCACDRMGCHARLFRAVCFQKEGEGRVLRSALRFLARFCITVLCGACGVMHDGLLLAVLQVISDEYGTDPTGTYHSSSDCA